MRQSLARFSGPESSPQIQSLADFIATTSGFSFSVHTGTSVLHGDFVDAPILRGIIDIGRFGVADGQAQALISFARRAPRIISTKAFMAFRQLGYPEGAPRRAEPSP